MIIGRYSSGIGSETGATEWRYFCAIHVVHTVAMIESTAPTAKTPATPPPSASSTAMPTVNASPMTRVMIEPSRHRRRTLSTPFGTFWNVENAVPTAAHIHAALRLWPNSPMPPMMRNVTSAPPIWIFVVHQMRPRSVESRPCPSSSPP